MRGCEYRKDSTPPRLCKNWGLRPDALYFRSELGEAEHQVFIAAIDAVDVPQDGAALRGEHAYKEYGRGPEGRRADEFRAAQVARARDLDAMRIKEHRVGAEPVELGVINSALL